MKRRNVLLGILVLASAVLVVDLWPEPQPAPQFDPRPLSIEELIDGLTPVDGQRASACMGEIQRRGWQQGPAAVRMVLEHASPTVRASAFHLLAFTRMDLPPASNARVTEWREQLVEVLRSETDDSVRQTAVVELCSFIFEELIEDVPAPLLDRLRTMLSAPDETIRSRAAACAYRLERHAAPLIDDLLALGKRRLDVGEPPGILLAAAVSYAGPSDARARSFLLGLIEHPDGKTRAAALHALGRLDLDPGQAAEALRLALNDPEPFDGPADWLACVAALSTKVQDELLLRRALETVSARRSSSKDLRDDPATAAAALRVALRCQRDDIVDATATDLWRALDTAVEDEASLLRTFPSKRIAVLESLVDLCRARPKTGSRPRVQAALLRTAEHRYAWVRRAAREQLARLGG